MVVPVGLNFTRHDAARSGVNICFGEPLSAQDYCQDGTLDANALRSDLAYAMKGMVTHVNQADDYERIVRQLEESGVDYMDPVNTNRRISEITNGRQPAKLVLQPRDGVRNFFIRMIHLPVLWGWRWLRSIIRDPMFIGSLKFVYAVFAVPIYYVMVALMIWLVFC